MYRILIADDNKQITKKPALVMHWISKKKTQKGKKKGF